MSIKTVSDGYDPLPGGVSCDQGSGAVPPGRALCASASVVVPTRNAERHLPSLLARLQATVPPPKRVLFIDTDSTDGTAAMITDAGYTLKVIKSREFGHGRTRNLGLDLCSDSDHVVYLTQDALPIGRDWLANLLTPFATPDVAVVFGRQLPRPNASMAERFPRVFNYPDTSEITAEPDIGRRGIKAVFCSNSFAAYDRRRLLSIGGFPENLPSSEDIVATFRLLRAGYRRTYCAKAMAVHSHHYTLRQEFRRYFDIGASLACDAEMRSASVATASAGTSVLLAQMRYARTGGGFGAVLGVLIRTASKFSGFQLGRHHRRLPRGMCRLCSMHVNHWSQA